MNSEHKKLHICFISMNYPYSHGGGGAGTYTQITARELARRGHKVFVIARYIDSEPESYSDEGVQVSRIKTGKWYWYFARIPFVGRFLGRIFSIIASARAVNREIAKINKKYKLDIVEFPEIANFLFKLSFRIPYIVHIHATEYLCKKFLGEPIHIEDKMQRCLDRLMFKGARFIISPSKFLADEVAKELKLKADKVHTIPYPLDLSQFPLPQHSKEEGKNVYYAGRFERRKGVDTLLEAIPLVVKELVDTTFWLFGSFTKDMSQAYIGEVIKKYGIDENVQIVSHIPREALLDSIKKFDLCVFPSLFDNSPYVIYEAMALEKAAVATKAPGGMPELIDHEETGLLVAPNNSKDLADAIIKLLKDDNKRNKMGTLAHKKALDYYEVSKITDLRLQLYSQAIKTKGGK